MKAVELKIIGGAPISSDTPYFTGDLGKYTNLNDFWGGVVEQSRFLEGSQNKCQVWVYAGFPITKDGYFNFNALSGLSVGVIIDRLNRAARDLGYIE